MGAKTWMLVYAEGDPSAALRVQPALDRDGTLRLAGTLFPEDKLQEVGSGNLSYTNPPDKEIHIGSFPGVAVVAAREFGGDYPSKLSPHFLEAGPFPDAYLHAMHSVVDWFAYAHWSNGKLVRALSLSPDSGVLEDIGRRLPFSVSPSRSRRGRSSRAVWLPSRGPCRSNSAGARIDRAAPAEAFALQVEVLAVARRR
jgi:hypothetical protein